MDENYQLPTELCATGVSGLDEVLGGGLPPRRLYLIEGNPGTGKTTLALQFLLEGSRRRERGLYVSLSESEEEVRDVAGSHGWDLAGVDLVDLAPAEAALSPEEDYSMFRPSEVDLGETTRAILDAVESRGPSRVVIDALSGIRTLAQTPFRYRRQIVALKQFFARRRCTVLLLDDQAASASMDSYVRSVVHGVLSLEKLSPEFGAERRRVTVVKLRGRSYRSGFHDFVIERGGLRVFARAPFGADRVPEGPAENVSSGIASLDALLGGGLSRGTSVLLQGPTGSGKSSIALQFAAAAAKRGERAAVFLFEETSRTLLARADGLGMGLTPLVRSGAVRLRHLDPGELSPGQFAQAVQEEVDAGARVVVIDSLNGYLNAMPEERFLTIQLRELLTELARKDVLTLLVLAQHGVLGGGLEVPIAASYLADSLLLLRHYECRGELRQAISVLKKREGPHEHSIRELRLRPGGIEIGEPLTEFHGVFTGMPLIVEAKPGGADG